MAKKRPKLHRRKGGKRSDILEDALSNTEVVWEKHWENSDIPGIDHDLDLEILKLESGKYVYRVYSSTLVFKRKNLEPHSSVINAVFAGIKFMKGVISNSEFNLKNVGKDGNT